MSVPGASISLRREFVSDRYKFTEIPVLSSSKNSSEDCDMDRGISSGIKFDDAGARYS
jgi:hypothetical protein